MKSNYVFFITICLLSLTLTPVLFAQEDELQRANDLHEQVIHLYQQGQYEKAIPIANMALCLYEHALGPNHPYVATSLNTLAALYYSMGSYSEAEPLYQRALKIDEKALGPDHPSVATDLNNLALLYQSMGSYNEAEPLYQRALKIREVKLGNDHPHVAQSLNNLATLYKSMGSYSESEPLYQRALKIKEKQLGHDHPSVATSLNNLAGLYYSMGSYSEAESLYQRALKIREEKLSPNHPDIAQSLNNLAALYQSMGSFNEAEPLYQQALKIVEKALGPDHPDVAISLNNLAGLYESKGSYNEAEPLYQRALKIREEKLGPNHPDVASSLNDLAGLYESKGSYNEAEPLYQRALKILEKKLGSNHPEVATSLNNLAELYRSMGSYSLAEPLYQRALKIYEKALGPDHPDLANGLNNLATSYKSMGSYNEAEPLYQRALKIYEKALGTDHPYVAYSLNNLAELYRSMGSYSKAEPLYQRALKIVEKKLGPDHPNVAPSLNNLALLYLSLGSYSKAESLYQRALKICEEKLGPDHPDMANSLNNLAAFYKTMGSYSEAKPLYQRALKIYEKALGPDHPDLANGLNNLATLYKSMGSYSEAEPLYQRALKIREEKLGPDHPDVAASLSNIMFLWGSTGNCKKIFFNAKRLTLLHFHHYHTILPYLSEKRQLDYVQENFPLSLLWPSLYVQYGQKYSEFQPIISEVLLNHKGTVYEILTSRKQQLKLDDKKVMSLLDNLNTIRTHLANAYFGEPSNVDQLMRFIPSLLAQQEQLESELAREGYEVETQKTPISSLQLCRSLPEDYTLVDFWYFPGYIFKGENIGWGDYHYLAIVYQAKCEPEVIHVGEADSIDKSIIELRQAIFVDTLNKTQTKPNNLAAEQFVKAMGKKLYQQLFTPLLSTIRDNQKVIICADGPLHYLPFGVLVDEQNRYLVERYQFHYVSTSRDILNWGKKQGSSNQNAFIMAKSKFQQKEQELPYTAAEAIAIDSLLKRNNFSSKLNLDDQARESLLKSAQSPQILHISTHGFFKPAPEEPRIAREIGLASFQKTIRRGLVENPLLRSGLILTGTNQSESTQTGDDGIATALEIAGLDLAETDLVTLSACVTGIGDLKSGEGLYGLHRSFLLAGAKTVLASLWSVPDLETKDLMIEFYRRYLSDSNMSKTEALQQAQLTVIKNLREKYGAAPPAYWGAFVCIGEP